MGCIIRVSEEIVAQGTGLSIDGIMETKSRLKIANFKVVAIVTMATTKILGADLTQESERT